MRIILISLVVICGLHLILARSLSWSRWGSNNDDESFWPAYEDDDLFDITKIIDDDAVYKKFAENWFSDDYDVSTKATGKFIFDNDDEDKNDNQDDEITIKDIEELADLIKSLNIDGKVNSIDDQENDNNFINNDDSVATGNSNILISLIIGVPNSSEETNEPKDINEVLDEFYKDLDDQYKKSILNNDKEDDADVINDVDNIKNLGNDDKDKSDDSVPNLLEETNEPKDINEVLNELLKDLDDEYTRITNILNNDKEDDADVINDVDNIKNIGNDDKDKSDEFYNKNENHDMNDDDDKSNSYDKNNNNNGDDNRNEDNAINGEDDDDTYDTDNDQFSIIFKGDHKKSLDDHKYEIIPTITVDSNNSFNNKDKYNTDNPKHEYELIDFKSLDDEKNEETQSHDIYE